MNEDVPSIEPKDKSVAVPSIADDDEQLGKAKRRQSNNLSLILVGAILLGAWLVLLAATIIETSINATSVSTLIALLFAPMMLAGIGCIIIGTLGYLLAKSNQKKIEHERSVTK